MKLLIFILAAFVGIPCLLSSSSSVPSCFALLSLGKSLPDKFKTPKPFKSLSRRDFSLTATTTLELSQLAIPLRLTFFFDRRGKLTYKSNPSLRGIQAYADKLKDPKSASEIIRKTIKITALSVLESILKEGLRTKIGFAFPHLGFFIAIEEILNAYKPHLQRSLTGGFIAHYYYALGGEYRPSRVQIKLRFNKLKIEEIVRKYEVNLAKFEKAWNMKKTPRTFIEEYKEVIKERLFHLKWFLNNVLNNKDYRGKMTEVQSRRLAKSILLDKDVYTSFLRELQRNVLSGKFSRLALKLKNSNIGSFNWYEELLSYLSPTARSFAKKNLGFLYAHGVAEKVSAKGTFRRSSFNTDDRLRKNGPKISVSLGK